MANATITTLINDLATVTINSTATDDYQDEIFEEIARLAKLSIIVQTGAAFQQVTGGTATYTLPQSPQLARMLLALMYGPRQLAQSRKDEAWMLSEEWRASTAYAPIAYLQDPENRVQYTVVPPPKIDGATPSGTPTGNTFVDQNLTIFYTYTDTAWSGATYADTHLPIAFEVLSRELSRDSDHQDTVAAEVAEKFAMFLFGLAFPESALPGVKSGAS